MKIARWNFERRCWLIPLSAHSIRAIRLKFGELIEYDPTFGLSDLHSEIVIRQMSRSTLMSYIYFNRELIRHSNKSPIHITDDDMRSYIQYLVTEKKLSPATVNLAIDSLKFYHSTVLRKKFVGYIERPKKGVRLPNVLSTQEVTALFAAVKNIKHKSLLVLTYSSGLRVSETVTMRLRDIDFDRKLVIVRQGKGRKDRCTILSDRAAELMKSYIEIYRPSVWMFEGRRKRDHITVRSAEHLFETAVHRAGIIKHVTFHSLRHSFATHLLENGIDIRYIQELLGHKSVRTTEVYTHVQKKRIEKIRSPFDML
jgi:site-specific recombinase XerD